MGAEIPREIAQLIDVGRRNGGLQKLRNTIFYVLALLLRGRIKQCMQLPLHQTVNTDVDAVA